MPSAPSLREIDGRPLVGETTKLWAPSRAMRTARRATRMMIARRCSTNVRTMEYYGEAILIVSAQEADRRSASPPRRRGGDERGPSVHTSSSCSKIPSLAIVRKSCRQPSATGLLILGACCSTTCVTTRSSIDLIRHHEVSIPLCPDGSIDKIVKESMEHGSSETVMKRTPTKRSLRMLCRFWVDTEKSSHKKPIQKETGLYVTVAATR